MRLKGTTIPDYVVERVVAYRGAEHPFAELDPSRTALVVIDLQHAFMNEAVGFAPVRAARDIVPAVNRLAAAVRLWPATIVPSGRISMGWSSPLWLMSSASC